jgi:hypothetical protein
MSALDLRLTLASRTLSNASRTRWSLSSSDRLGRFLTAWFARNSLIHPPIESFVLMYSMTELVRENSL